MSFVPGTHLQASNPEDLFNLQRIAVLFAYVVSRWSSLRRVIGVVEKLLALTFPNSSSISEGCKMTTVTQEGEPFNSIIPSLILRTAEKRALTLILERPKEREYAVIACPSAYDVSTTKLRKYLNTNIIQRSLYLRLEKPLIFPKARLSFSERPSNGWRTNSTGQRSSRRNGRLLSVLVLMRSVSFWRKIKRCGKS